MSEDKSGCISWIFGIGLVGLLIYGLIKGIIWLSHIFVAWGNLFLIYLDYHFMIPAINPIVTWGIVGLFFGGLIGVIIAIKKLKLSWTLLLYPFAAMVLLITIMSFVDKSEYGKLPNGEEEITITKEFYKVNTNSNVRSEPSLQGKKLFVLETGTEIECISKGHFDSRGLEWCFITHNGNQGYISTKLLYFSRKGTIQQEKKKP